MSVLFPELLIKKTAPNLVWDRTLHVIKLSTPLGSGHHPSSKTAAIFSET